MEGSLFTLPSPDGKKRRHHGANKDIASLTSEAVLGFFLFLKIFGVQKGEGNFGKSSNSR